MDFGYEDGRRMLIVAETVLFVELSVLSAQFCCEPKTAPRNCFFFWIACDLVQSLHGSVQCVPQLQQLTITHVPLASTGTFLEAMQILKQKKGRIVSNILEEG